MEELNKQDEVQSGGSQQNEGENPFGVKPEDVQTPEQPQIKEDVVVEEKVEQVVEEVPSEKEEKKGFFAKLFGK